MKALRFGKILFVLLFVGVTAFAMVTSAWAQNPVASHGQLAAAQAGAAPGVYVDPRSGVAWQGVLFPTPVGRCCTCRAGRSCTPLIDPRLLGISPIVKQPFVSGPPIGTVVYPYYTVRGPRDFLAGNPPPIGP